MITAQRRPLSSSVGRFQGERSVSAQSPAGTSPDPMVPLPSEMTPSPPATGGGAGPDPVTGAPSPAGTGVQPPTQLPDGAGGAVPVPPPPMAPPSTVNPLPSLPGYGSPIAPPAGATTDATEQFGPDSNLINTQINATSDPRTLNLQGQEDAQLGKILNGPDRNAMAHDQYNTWEQETAPSFEHDITDATDAAAAHGQIRSGQLTNRYGDLARQRVLDKTTARNRYMQNALDSSIADTQRGFEDVSGAAGRAYNEGAAGREEQRGERGYEASRAQQALVNRIQQYLAETGAQNTAFNQGSELYGAGNAGDPYGALAAASGQSAAEAEGGMSDVAALLQALARRKAAAA